MKEKRQRGRKGSWEIGREREMKRERERGRKV